jgi:hypothetical protein
VAPVLLIRSGGKVNLAGGRQPNDPHELDVVAVKQMIHETIGCPDLSPASQLNLSDRPQTSSYYVERSGEKNASQFFYCSGEPGKTSDLITTGTDPEDSIKAPMSI